MRTLTTTLVALASASICSANVLYESPDGAGSAPEYGLTLQSGEAPDGSPALVIGGDPDGKYAKFYNETKLDGGNSMFITIPIEDRGQPFTLSYDVYLPADSQIESSDLHLQFYRDPDADGRINFDGDEENKVDQAFYGKTLFDVTDQWQTVIVSGTIPEMDQGGAEIEALRFNVSFEQTNVETNTAPITAYVRNIIFETSDR